MGYHTDLSISSGNSFLSKLCFSFHQTIITDVFFFWNKKNSQSIQIWVSWLSGWDSNILWLYTDSNQLIPTCWLVISFDKYPSASHCVKHFRLCWWTKCVRGLQHNLNPTDGFGGSPLSMFVYLLKARPIMRVFQTLAQKVAMMRLQSVSTALKQLKKKNLWDFNPHYEIISYKCVVLHSGQIIQCVCVFWPL